VIMRWATLSHLHLDRVAACWLIRRFLDPDAQFTFVEWGLAALSLPPLRTPYLRAALAKPDSCAPSTAPRIPF
jgi:hypothetical protein